MATATWGSALRHVTHLPEASSLSHAVTGSRSSALNSVGSRIAPLAGTTGAATCATAGGTALATEPAESVVSEGQFPNRVIGRATDIRP